MTSAIYDTRAAREALAHAGEDVAAVTWLVGQLERNTPATRTVRIGLSGNVTLDLLATFLRKHAALAGLGANIHIGPIADRIGGLRGLAAEGVDAVVILDLFDALMPALEARAEHLDPDLVHDRVDRYRAELDLALVAVADVPHVFVGTLHPISAPGADPRDAGPAVAIAAFNEVLAASAAAHSNVELIDTAALCGQIGWDRSHDLHSYRRFAAPFAPAFVDAVAREAFVRTRGFGSYFLKALILDCDGTLWGGAIGEELIGGIALAPQGGPGAIFWDVQQRLLGLQRSGVLLGLCSKNNEADVAEVFARHPHMVLRDEHIAIRRINWNSKVENLRGIANALGIGLDALVFLDDSAIECEGVRAQLPMVRTLQVPADLAAYPRLMDEMRVLFQVGRAAAEGANKTEQYRIRELAVAERANFETQDDYLASLNISVTITRNERSSAARIAELTQKSNQFNLTTRRRTEAEVLAIMASGQADVLSVHVQDRFGDSGLTGVAIVTYAGDEAAVDTFLLSCRILGRGVEDACWPAMIDAIRARACSRLVASYLPTAKNGQVREYWARVGFDLTSEDAAGRREYRLDLSAPNAIKPPVYVEVNCAF